MHNTPGTLNSTTALHSRVRHATTTSSSRATEPLHRRLLRRVTATWRSGGLALLLETAGLSHVHGRAYAGVCARGRDVRARGIHVRARVRDPGAAGGGGVVQLGVGRVGGLVLALGLRALLLLGLLAHLQHLALAH